MEIPPDEKHRLFFVGLATVVTTMVLLTRSVLLFIPFAFLFIFWLWQLGGTGERRFEEDDPADWWKKGKKTWDE